MTITAPQSLAMLNSELTLDLAQKWAGRLVTEHGGSPDDVIQSAYRAAFGREASAKEIDLAKQFLAGELQLIAKEKPNRRSSANVPSNVDRAAAAAFCHALFNSNEFITVD